MNQISWRHHYIPQFYLNGFTSKDGKFKIYDIQKKDFIKKGKDFSPESYFFEEDGNAMITENGSTDFIEEYFKKIDGKAAEVFNRINKSSSIEKYNINDDDIAMLQYFIGIMYWRIPTNYDEIRSIIDQKKLKELGLILKNKNNETSDDTELENRLKKDVNFFKAMKFHFPIISYPEIFNCKTPLHIKPIPDGLPLICSDNPIICRNPDTFRVYSDDFIFPLTSTKLFIRGEKIIDFMSTVKIEIDLLTYKQAKKYVSCTDERYLTELDKMFLKSNKNLNDLRFSIFKQILNYAY
jgi:hypothetical protein